MKRFIVKILLLIFPIIVLAIPIEILLRRIPNDYTFKKEYLDKNSEKIQILIMGASDTYYGINPVYFSQKTFNASHISQSINIDFKIFQKYQNRFNNLNIIVLPISYCTFWDQLENGVDSWRIKNYVIYYGLKEKYISKYFELLNVKLHSNIYRIYDYYYNKRNIISCSTTGWGTSFKSEKSKNLIETGIKTALNHQLSNDIVLKNNPNVFYDNLNILNSFFEYCNKHNVKILFLTTPTYYNFRENLNAKYLNTMNETINNFVKQHSNCYYFNWLDDIDFVVEDFYDANHLNEIGAEKLSKKLSQIIDSLEIMN